MRTSSFLRSCRPLAYAWIAGAVCATAGLAGEEFMKADSESPPGALWLYVGTYTNGRTPSEGIYLLEMDPVSGSVTPRGVAARVENPSFLAIHPSHKFLYAVNEVDSFQGKKGGGVSALAIDPSSGQLTLLNQQSSVGSSPCHLSVDRTGKNILVANYGSGSVACLPIEADGSLKPASAFVQHKGKSVDRGRQQGPHAHEIELDQANRFAFTPDLGLDKVLIYRFDAAQGSLTPSDPPFARVDPGSGPRHLAFHPSGRFAYVISEMGNTITAFAHDADKGTLRKIQTISSLPDGFNGKSYCAEVEVHPSGKFVYGSNRGHDSIAIFTVDAATGKLSAAGHQSTLGKNPRHFAIDPTGTFLLAANQDSDSIVVLRIDQETGGLKQVGQPVHIPMPVCIQMTRWIWKPGREKD
ncbi:MAG: lactonase family protein [Isosphaeraceae bacterium]